MPDLLAFITLSNLLTGIAVGFVIAAAGTLFGLALLASRNGSAQALANFEGSPLYMVLGAGFWAIMALVVTCGIGWAARVVAGPFLP